MAELTGTNCVKIWQDGLADTAVLYSMRLITTGDTMNLAAEFLSVKRAVVIATTTDKAAQAAVAGTIVTMPNGLAGDGGWLLAWGVHA